MSARDELIDAAQKWLAARRIRNGHFPPDLFDETAWDMLLRLFVASERGQAISVDELIALTSRSDASGRRWLLHLEQEGTIEPRPTTSGDAAVTLTETARRQMESCMADVLKGMAQAREASRPA